MNYFVRTEAGLEYGPLSSKQLRDAAQSGALSRRDLLRPDGTVDWFRADKVRGLDFVDPSAITVITQPAPEPAPAPPIEPPGPVRKDGGLIRHIEPLAMRGFNVRKLEGEEVESVEPQSFLDAFRLSMLAAVIGRRGVLVLTNRRVFVTNATISTRALQSAYLDRIDRIGFGSRAAMLKLLGGAMIALMGIAWQIGPSLWGLLVGAGLTVPALEWRALVLIAIGVVAILLARYRALEIGVASGTIMFAKRSLELDTLSRIDEIRERRLAHLSSGATDDAQIS